MLKVRKMAPQDIDEVFRINQENFTTDAWSRFAFEKEFENKLSKKFVLELDGRIVGYIIYWVVRDEATIMTFAIDKEHQNRGYGEFLLRESLKKINAKRILLDVRKTNLRAINLYRKLGFRLVSERKAYYSDGENALFMELIQ